jgi:trans-aconitate 2-methyltransferase
MVERARARLGEDATILFQDLLELSLPEPVDVVFSNATFHWVADHDALFASLYRSLRPGGRLVAQCGGIGNIDGFRKAADSVAAEEPFAHCFVGWQRPWNYASAKTVVLVRHLDPLPQELRGPFIDRVLKRAGEPLVLEYVRLNMVARREHLT